MPRTMLLLVAMLAACATGHSNSRLSPAVLENGAWTIAAYFNGSTLVSSSDVFRRPGFVVFEKGTLDGSPGCGSLVGSYNIAADEIAIESRVLLTGSCLTTIGGRSVDLLPFSNLVTSALNRTRTVEEVDEGVYLKGPDGRIEIALTRRD